MEKIKQHVIFTLCAFVRGNQTLPVTSVLHAIIKRQMQIAESSEMVLITAGTLLKTQL